jgi:hypothetical protein
MGTITNLTPVRYHPLEDVNSRIGPTYSATGTPTYSAVKFGNGGDFQSGNYLTSSFDGSQPENPSDDCTFDAWLKPDVASGTTTVSPFGFSDKTAAPWGYSVDIRFYTTGGGQCGIFIFENNVAKLDYRYSLTYSAGELFHLRVVLDSTAGANNRALAYKNGSLLSLPTVNTDTTWNLSAGTGMTKTIGAFARGFSETFDGKIDNFKLYDNSSQPWQYTEYPDTTWSKKRR